MTEPHPAPRLATQPRTSDWIGAAVAAGGGSVVEPADATGVVWTDPAGPDALADLLAAHPAIDWVQLPWAGVEPYLDVIRAKPGRTWSCAKGVYSDPVGEHAVALLLAGFRDLHRFARQDTWVRGSGRNLFGAKVVLLGGGGIAQVVIDLLAPFRTEITVVRNTPAPMAGVDRVLGPDALHRALDGADAVVLALPLVAGTRHVLGAEELALLAPGAWVVNVARGEHIDTDALVAALEGGHLGGAALDVTDPEPLPDGHPLWSAPNAIITPHTGNTAAMARPLLSARITENVRAYASGGDLVGLIDADLGY
ncbi:dihydrofolate reductase [Aquihabitans sp. G128]|uniref:NAD(P)-dependent oxidoreductase n=1 Tax=Aquihabitans sp. G128 TaxID=2849779 RepID=UPI001C24060A|nr:NAD(P)-dependent oxidoreductase [Aquihabitans sp. G128]QXC61754.1 dihydrofolate reductase [Aquihabitans sp. G128]